MANIYNRTLKQYYPVHISNKGEELDHKKDPVKMFDDCLDRHAQDIVDDIFDLSKTIYCQAENLRGQIDDKTVEYIKEKAGDIAKSICAITSDRVSYYYDVPVPPSERR